MTPIGRILASLVLAVIAPWAVACIGLPVSLMLSTSSSAIGVFATLFFSPIIAAPVALLLGLPILIGLSKFSRLGLFQCALAGAVCSIPGVYVVATLLTRQIPTSLSFGRDEMMFYLLAGVVFGALFWAAHRLTFLQRSRAT